jgi:hypothetical protein
MDINHSPNHPKIKSVRKIIKAIDDGRLDTYGGYPSDWIICDDTLIWATVIDENEPDLKIMKVDDFIEEHKEFLYDDR